MGSIPIGHTYTLFIEKTHAVCPGGEGAVLKTVGLKGLAGSNPVYGAYRWMSRIGIAADCKSVASALGVQVSLRSVKFKYSLTRADEEQSTGLFLGRQLPFTSTIRNTRSILYKYFSSVIIESKIMKC